MIHLADSNTHPTSYDANIAMEAFVRGLPKAELHVHIEGSFEPELVFQLAKKNGITLPYANVESLRDAYKFTDLQSFLNLYYAAANVLVEEADFYALTWAYLQRVHEQGVVHVEIFFDPQTHTNRGIPFATVLSGIRRALLQAERDFGMSQGLILCLLRHLSADEAMRTLEEALPFKEAFIAIGLDSSEVGNPPSKFTAVFQRVRDQGWPVVAHAGEEGPPAYIHEALDLLKAQRIDHGVTCETDPALMARLRRDRVPLTVCPLSNVRLQVFENMEQHSLKRLLDYGLCVTVNSDDPAYFNGYVLENYLAVQRAFQLSHGDLKALARNSFEASFLESGVKREWLDAVNRYAAAVEGT